MTRLGIAAAMIATAMASACAEAGDGRAAADEGDGGTGTPTAVIETVEDRQTAQAPSTSDPASAEPALPAMGVTPTLREAIPANALVCAPTQPHGAATPVQVSDPAAPRIVVALPAGWNATPHPAGATLTGPDGSSGVVEITHTDLDPTAAFEKYADDIAALAPISSISVLPDENCGYSGQRLMGIVSGGPQGSQTFEDRVAHVWTNTKDYLVAIHVGAPGKTPSFDVATPVLLADFPITIP
jgi:hypothetical protein